MRGTGAARSGPKLITVTATVFAVLAVALLLLSGLPGPAAVPSRGATGASSHVRPFVIPATTIFLNRSQQGGTFVFEGVTVNNSTSLTQLPHTFTSVNGCRWITVVNLTTTLDPTDSINYVNVTVGNDTGTVVAKNALVTGFQVCAGHAAFVNFAKFSYDIYTWNFATLGAQGNLTFVNYTTGGVVISVGKNYTIAAGGSIALKVWTNETFYVTYPKTVTGTTSCSVLGVCKTPSWTFSAATTLLPVSNTTTKVTNKFPAVGSTGYRNWTVSYSESNATSTVGGGAFIVGIGNFWSTWVVPFWWAWTVLVLAIIVGVAVSAGGRRRSR